MSTAHAPATTVRLIEPQAEPARDVLGVSVTRLVSNNETGDHFCIAEAVVPPGVGIPLHSHPDVEMFYVIEGELRLMRMVNNTPDEMIVGTNQAGFVPSNALHGFINAGTIAARVIITCTKGLEQFLMEAGTPVDRNAAPQPPSPQEIERVLSIARKYGQVFV